MAIHVKFFGGEGGGVNFSHLGCYLQSCLIHQQNVAYGCGMNFSGLYKDFFFNYLQAAKYVFTHDSHTFHHPFFGDVLFSTAVLCMNLLL